MEKELPFTDSLSQMFTRLGAGLHMEPSLNSNLHPGSLWVWEPHYVSHHCCMPPTQALAGSWISNWKLILNLG